MDYLIIMILQKEIEFILAVDALKNVNRRNFNADNTRRENTAEHSWQVVVFAQILYPYARNRDQIDLGKVIRMLSIHDIVEVYAGDVFFFDDAANVGKFERELEAAKKIFGILPEALQTEFLNLWLEFEEVETPEAVFANAVDRLIPFTLNCHNGAVSWLEAGVTADKVKDLLRPVIAKASDEMGETFDALFNKAVAQKLLV